VNLVSIVSAGNPAPDRCGRCHVIVRPLHDRVLDGAGGAYCRDGVTLHAPRPDRAQPVVSASPLLSARVRSW
jgi:hypothetical protein